MRAVHAGGTSSVRSSERSRSATNLRGFASSSSSCESRSKKAIGDSCSTWPMAIRFLRCSTSLRDKRGADRATSGLASGGGDHSARGKAHAPHSARGKAHAPHSARGKTHAPRNARGKTHAPQNARGKTHAPQNARGKTRTR
eukprot:1205003-Prymnesium_polylepis.1